MTSYESFKNPPFDESVEQEQTPRPEDSTHAERVFDEEGSHTVARVRSVIDRIKEELLSKSESVERLAAKGVVGFALASVFASLPQYAAAAPEKGFQTKQTVREVESGRQDESLQNGDEMISKLNEEFAQFAKNDVEKRKLEFWEGEHFKENDRNKEFQKDVMVETIMLGTRYSVPREDVEKFYAENESKIDGVFEGYGVGSTKVTSAIDILPEGGVMVKISGGFDKMGDIPQAFMGNLHEIKENPSRYVASQLLNFAVHPLKKPVERYLDEHSTARSVE